ncbi:MAG: NAD(P)/FAD-dependent oxidoreductase, partial [Leucothrix sp.]
GAIAEHGAQFVTARSSRFKALINEWLEAGIVTEWWRGENEDGTAGYPRYRGVPTMSAMAKQLAKELNIRSATKAISVTQQDGGWLTLLEAGDAIFSQQLIITAPAPQTVDLLNAGGVAISAAHLQQLTDIEYEPCIAVMARLSNATEIPQNGALPISHGPIAWIADNEAKGVSEKPSVTLHASADYSRENWHRDRQTVGQEMLSIAEQLLGASVLEFQVHGWLYSKPVTTETSPCLVVSDEPLMVLAGDAFGGPKIEGAVLSGWAAAEVAVN